VVIVSKRRRSLRKAPSAPIPVVGSQPAKAGRRSISHEERHAGIRRAQRLRSIRRWTVLGVIGVAVVAGVVYVTGAALPQLGEAAPMEGGVGVHLQDGAPLPQRNRPPSSGPHYAGRAAYGVSSAPIPPGNWIHALEHGGIAVLFRCPDEDSCSATAKRVDAEVYRRARPGAFGEPKLVGTPYQEMDSPFAAVAWGRILRLEVLDAGQILAFYDRYLDRGPEKER
jgi:hypothetical protein